MLSPDNYVHGWLGSQGYNRYSYVGNNPLRYVDPSGEVVITGTAILVAAAIGGGINFGVQLARGRVTSLQDGVVAFGIGALAGTVGVITGGVAVGAAGVSATTGATAALSGAIGGAAGGAVGGAVQGVGNAVYFQTGDPLKEGAKGLLIGAASGAVLGAAFGYGAFKLKPAATPTPTSSPQGELNVSTKVNNLGFEDDGIALYQLGDDATITATRAPRAYWKGFTTFRGTRVYQRNDLIDPSRVVRGKTNLQRMQQGHAPVGPDGKSMNLHHLIQSEKGSLAEVTATFHQANSSTLHINPNSWKSGINRTTFKMFREAYWMARALDFQ